MLTPEQRKLPPAAPKQRAEAMMVFGVDMSPLSLVRMIWKRKIGLVVIWAAVTIAVGFYVSRLPAIYSTSALIILDSQKIPERYVSATVNTDVQDRFATISQQLLSSAQLKKMIDQFNLYAEERKTRYAEEITEKMRKDIKITPERSVTGSRPGAFRISYEGPNPVVVAQVVNQIANLYIEENLKTREEQAGGTSEFIESQLAAAKEKLDELEASVSTYKVRHNGELPQQEMALSGILSRLQVELEANREAANRAQTAKVALEHSLAMAEEALQTQIRSVERATLTGQAISPDKADAPPVKESESLKTKLTELRTRYSDEHPDVLQAMRRLERALAAEAAEANAFRREPTTPQTARAKPAPTPVRDTAEIRQTRERVKSFQAQIEVGRQEIETRKNEQKRILADISTYQARITRLPVREQEMAQITRDYEMAKANYRSLLEKKTSADMAADMERRQKAERFTIADPARVPGKPASPNRPALQGAGFVAGLAFGLLWAFGREMKNGVLLGAWQVPSHVAVIGKVHQITPSSLVAERRGPRGWFRKREAFS